MFGQQAMISLNTWTVTLTPLLEVSYDGIKLSDKLFIPSETEGHFRRKTPVSALFCHQLFPSTCVWQRPLTSGEILLAAHKEF